MQYRTPIVNVLFEGSMKKIHHNINACERYRKLTDHRKDNLPR